MQRRNDLLWALASSIVMGSGIVAVSRGQLGRNKKGAGKVSNQNDASNPTPDEPRRTPEQAEGERPSPNVDALPTALR